MTIPEPSYVTDAKQYQREYYLKHRDSKLEYQKARRVRDNELRRLRYVPKQRKAAQVIDHDVKKSERSEINKKYHLEKRSADVLREKFKALQIVSGCKRPTCRCGVTDIRALTINHLNGGGRSDYIGFKGSVTFRKAIISGVRGVDDLDVRCMNCNMIYEYERGRNKLPRGWERIIEDASK
jgi:hypothetical protein